MRDEVDDLVEAWVAAYAEAPAGDVRAGLALDVALVHERLHGFLGVVRVAVGARGIR